MLFSVMNCLNSLCWATLLIGMIIYMVGIFITQLVTAHVQEYPHAVESDVVDLYGSLGVSMLSLYMAITGGADWGDMMRPLVQDLSPLFYPGYALYIAFCVFALLNVVTGIFTEKAISHALDDRDAVIQDQLDRENSYVNGVRAALR